MKKKNFQILIILIAGLFLTVLSVPCVSAQSLHEEKYIFIEKFTMISGTSDQGYLLIDFPTYYYNTTAQTLTSQISVNLFPQTQVVYGAGLSLGGDVGGGISSQLYFYDNLVEPDTFSADTNGTVQFNHDGTWLTLGPGQTWTETIETNEYFGFTGALIVEHRIKNLGIWDKANFSAPGITPVPTEDPEITPTPVSILLGDVTTDGLVDIVDALLVAQFFVGLVPSGFNEAAADVNCDGVIDIIDALLIARYYVGLVSDFCVT